jgi:hypothetical protein
MSARLKRNIGFLRQLKQASERKRRRLILATKPDHLKCITECAHNILCGNVRITNGQKKKLKRHAKYIRLLAKKHFSLPKKKRLLVQRGGFLPALIAPILGIVGSLLSEYLMKNG